MIKPFILLLVVGAVYLSAPIAAMSEDSFCFNEAAAMYNVSPELLRAISDHESGHNHSAINWNDNGTYDYGHMQINSMWYRVLGPELWDSLSDVCQSTKVGAWVLAQCIQRHGYNWSAIGCYNAGSRRASRPKRIAYAWKIYRVLAYGRPIKNSGTGQKPENCKQGKCTNP